MRYCSHFSQQSSSDITNNLNLFKRFRLHIRAIYILIPILLGGLEQAFAAPADAVRHYDKAKEQQRFAQLLERYGENKELPEGYELQALLALSHYPELAHVRIRFIVDDVDIPLSSRPHWASLLNSAQNRTYLVVIDSDRDGGRDALLLKNQPFNAQIGIIGHELAHTVYYLDRSLFGIIGDALCQLSDCRVEFERATDRRLISYGLGWQRFDHALFVRSQFLGSEADAMAVEGGGGAYMSPAELLQEMGEFETYADQAAELRHGRGTVRPQ